MYKKLASVYGYTLTLALVAVFGAINVQMAEARTTPCGQYDPTYGYYGQCDANNQPIASTVVTQPTQPPANTNTGYNYDTGTGGTYSVNQYGYETTTQLPTVACNAYDTRQGGYVVCDATGKPTGYWITSQNGGGTNNITVNYSNPQSNTQSPSYYGNNSNALYGGYNMGSGYNYGNTGYNYGGYNVGYQDYYAPSYNYNPSFGTQLLGAVLGYALGSNSYYDNYSGGYSYGGGYNGGYDVGYYGSSYPTATMYTRTTPTYSTRTYNDTTYTTQGTNYYDQEIDNWYGGSGGGTNYYDDEIEGWY